MNAHIRQLHAIAGLTLRDATRQPICLLLTTACVLMIGLLPFVVTHALEDAERLVRDSAFAVHLGIGLILAAYVACASLAAEFRTGTASTVLSKPVDRGLFFLAKFVGVAAFVVLFSFLAALATVLSTRIAGTMDNELVIDWWAAGPLFSAVFLAYAYGGHMNYHRRKPFHSAAFGALLVLLVASIVLAGFLGRDGHAVAFGSALPLRILPVSALVTLAVIVLSAIAVALAPRLNMIPTLVICSVLLMAGLMSDYLLGARASEGALWALSLYSLLPNWQHFWVIDGLAAGGTIAPDYIANAVLYATVYVTGVLSLGVLAFRTVDLP